MRSRSTGIAILLALGLCACSVNLGRRSILARYDLGPEAPVPARERQSPLVVVVHDPGAPVWLDSRNMAYRLGYVDAARVYHYAGSQWIQSPPLLIGARLRHRLALWLARGGALPDLGVEADYWVRPALEEFEQVFDTEQQSRARVRLRVVLLKGRQRGFVAQDTFAAERAAPAPNAAGAVAA
ncbi:MAG: ABC-type transport auxiliary lipoprotein family protein, partial [Vicinamibacteria bacterium]|nr:ABC-type transport auxiliary lipoprotein family protein [Vicinamibacteria bacterium]